MYEKSENDPHGIIAYHTNKEPKNCRYRKPNKKNIFDIIKLLRTT